MNLSDRQKKIIEIIEEHGSITGATIANILGVTRSALRTDFSILKNSGIIKSKTKVGYTISEEKNSNLGENNLKKLKVKEFLGKALILEETTSIHDGIVEIFTKDSGTIYIVNGDSLVGVVSRKDLLKAAVGGGDLKSLPISLIMSRMPNIYYCTLEDTLFQVTEMIVKKEIDSIPVVEKLENSSKYKIIGKVSKTDLTKVLLANL
jgi:CBS domain-containing protein